MSCGIKVMTTEGRCSLDDGEDSDSVGGNDETGERTRLVPRYADALECNMWCSDTKFSPSRLSRVLSE